jgi:hypothetical protein
MVIGRFSTTGSYVWIIGVFNPKSGNDLYGRNASKPNAIEMTEIDENQTVRLFYTWERENDFILYKEIMYINFSNSVRVYVSIGTNCGSVIRANDQIVAVSCPEYRNVPLSVYSVDLVHLKTIEGMVNKQILHF